MLNGGKRTQKTINFLVVEDNELDAEKISRGFRRLSIANNLIVAANGFEALDLLRGSNGREKLTEPLVVILDIQMPRMGGFEFLQILRADPELSHLPVFVLSSSEDRKDIETANRMMVSGYIVKPLKLGDVLSAIGTLGAQWQLTEYPGA